MVQTQGSRPVQKYINHLDNIFMIQKYIEELAISNNINIIENYGLDGTVYEVLELIFQKLKEEFSKITV